MTTDLLPGWKWTTLGEVFEIVGGATPSTGESSFWGGDIPWLTPDDLAHHEGIEVARGRRSITASGYDSTSTHLLPKGAVLFSSRAPIGYAAIAAQPLCTNQGFKSLIPPDGVDSRYVYWYLRYATPAIREMGSGTTFKEMSKKRMAKVPFVLAPSQEQRRIVAAIEEHFSCLDAASDAMTVARARIEATSRSVLVEAFAGRLTPQDPTDEPASNLVSRVAVSEPARSVGRRTLPSSRRMTDRLPPNWVWARFDEIATTQLGKMLSAKSRQGKAPIPYLRNQNVQWHRIDLSDVASMDFTDSERVKYQLRPGDLLICEGGEVGRAAMWTQPVVEMCFQKALHRVRTRPGIEARWIEHFMRWSAQTGRFEEHTQGSTIAHLPQRDLRALMIPTPPSNEQRRIVATIEEHFSRLDAAGASIAAAQARIEATRRSVLVDAYAGRLTPQDSTEEQT